MLEVVEGRGVAWTSPEGSRTDYWQRAGSNFSLEVRELRRYQRFDCWNSETINQNSPRREFSGKACFGRAHDWIALLGNPELRGSFQVIGNPESKTHEVQVKFLEGTEILEWRANQHRSTFDPSHPVLITYGEESGWEVTIPLSVCQFDALAEEFDKGSLEMVNVGVSSYMLFVQDYYQEQPHDNYFLAPNPYNARAYRDLEFNFYTYHEGGASIWGALGYLHFVSNEATLTLSPPARQTRPSDDYFSLPEAIRRTIEREIDTRFGSAENSDRISATNREKVWVSRRIAFSYALRVARLGLRQANEFNSRLGEALDFLRQIQQQLNPLVPDSMVGTQRADEYRSLLTDFERSCDPRSWIWMRMNVETEVNAKKDADNYFRVSMLPMNDLTFTYIRNPILQYPAIEFIMADAMACHTTLEFGVKVEREKTWSTRSLFTVSVIAGAIIAYFSGLWVGLGVGGVLAPFGLIYQHHNRRARMVLYREMLSVCGLFSDSRISPEFVRQRLLSSTEKGAIWPVGLLSVVEHAAKRDSTTWVS